MIDIIQTIPPFQLFAALVAATSFVAVHILSAVKGLRDLVTWVAFQNLEVMALGVKHSGWPVADLVDQMREVNERLDKSSTPSLLETVLKRGEK